MRSRGWLVVELRAGAEWKRMWCAVQSEAEPTLAMFKDERAKKPTASLPLAGCKVETGDDEDTPYLLRITPPDGGEPTFLQATSAASQLEWLARLKRAAWVAGSGELRPDESASSISSSGLLRSTGSAGRMRAASAAPVPGGSLGAMTGPPIVAIRRSSAPKATPSPRGSQSARATPSPPESMPAERDGSSAGKDSVTSGDDDDGVWSTYLDDVAAAVEIAAAQHGTRGQASSSAAVGARKPSVPTAPTPALVTQKSSGSEGSPVSTRQSRRHSGSSVGSSSSMESVASLELVLDGGLLSGSTSLSSGGSAGTPGVRSTLPLPRAPSSGERGGAGARGLAFGERHRRHRSLTSPPTTASPAPLDRVTPSSRDRGSSGGSDALSVPLHSPVPGGEGGEGGAPLHYSDSDGDEVDDYNPWEER